MISVLSPLIIFVFKLLAYYGALKIRRLEARWMTASVCAGASFLAGMVPFPEMIQFVLSIAVAAFYINKNTGADLYPDSVGIPLAVEVISAFALQFAIAPLLGLL
ncbi:MAG: hypothetical protein ACOYNS_17350 [Bacteroidota bacterium]